MASTIVRSSASDFLISSDAFSNAVRDIALPQLRSPRHDLRPRSIEGHSRSDCGALHSTSRTCLAFHGLSKEVAETKLPASRYLRRGLDNQSTEDPSRCPM